MCLCTSLYLYYCFVLHLLCFCDVFFVLTLNRDWQSARRLSRLSLCLHSHAFCGCSLLSSVLSYLTVGARVAFSICVIDIFGSKLVMARLNSNAGNLEFGLVAAPLQNPIFHLLGRYSISSRNLRGFELMTITRE